eukprot:5017887-Amphidinium_carterae.2
MPQQLGSAVGGEMSCKEAAKTLDVPMHNPAGVLTTALAYERGLIQAEGIKERAIESARNAFLQSR